MYRYARWNGEKTINDWENCGGWQQSHIVMKQYEANVRVEYVTLDNNWRQ